MDTRYILETRPRARGAVRPILIAIVAVIALLAVAAWFLIIKPHQELVMADAGGHPSTPVTTMTRAAPPPANVAAMDISQLLAEARTAMHERRYLAPTEIGRAHVCTPVTNAHLVCRLLPEKKK